MENENENENGNELRLFVWEGFSPDNTNGLAFAIAKNETEARILVEEENGSNIYCWGELKIYPITKRLAKCVEGGA